MKFLKEKLDIVILAGQANAQGCGVGPVEEELIPNDNVFFLYDKRQIILGETGLSTNGIPEEPFVVDIAKEEKSGELSLGNFSLTFAYEYLKNGILKSDRKLLIIKAAVGGTGFQKGHWGLHDYLYLRLVSMVEYALSWNVENRVVALLWHQGEHDAFERNEPIRYRQHLFNLIEDVRTRFGNIAFIAGDFVNKWKKKNIKICTPIIKEIRSVIEESGNAAFIETAELMSNNEKIGNGDDLHFCRPALHDLGRKYFYAYRQLSIK